MKDYHFGVIATFDEATCRWTFRTQMLNGDESPFMEMQEVYNFDTYEWENAFMDRVGDQPVERANYVLLEEAVWLVQHRLDNYQPLSMERKP